MSERPVRVEFDLGPNAFGQRVRLVHERTTGGAFTWTLHRDPANQLDDSSVIWGLTDEQLRRLGSIAGDGERS